MLLSAFSPSPAGAALPDTLFDLLALDSPEPQPFALPASNGGNRFPERLMDAADLTGDGVRDIFASGYKVDVAGKVDAGVVFLFDGATRKLVYQLNPPELQTGAQFGFNMAVLPDVSGDGKDDIAVGAPYKDVYTGSGPGCGAPEPNGCNEAQGVAYMFSGATGRLLRTIDNPNPQADEGVFATFGARLGDAGDVTGDGKHDLIIGAPANDVPAGCGFAVPIAADCRKNEGEAFIFNAVTGALVRTLRIPAADRQEAACSTTSSSSRCGNLSNAHSPGDVDRDGVADQVVAAYSLRRPTITAPDWFGRVYVFSGATGAVLSRIDQPQPDSNAFWGLQDTAPNTPGDLNGDGAADIYVTGFNQDGFSGQPSAGRGWVFDGARSVATGAGVELFELRDPTPQSSEAFGWAASRTDYNRDGHPDVYLSGLQGINTETYVFDGRDGSLLKTLGLPPSEVQPNVTGNNGSALGWSSRAPGDLNGDGEPDYVAAAPFQDVGANQDQGRAFFFLSNVPVPPPPPPPPPPVLPAPITTVKPPPPPAPVVPRFTRCPSTSVNVINGTPGKDTIGGTAKADRIFALAGDDVVKGLAGDDCIDLGAGDDRANGGRGRDLVVGGSGRDRIGGDAGRDRLRGGSGDDRLHGGPGDDDLAGQSGDDRLDGSTGNDRVDGGPGRDLLIGGPGVDRLTGSSGDDRLIGGSSSDRLSGGSGNDRVSGGSGHDRISGGPGRDVLHGNTGNDTISARDGARDTIDCGTGRDSVTADRFDRVARNCERVRRF